MADPTVVQLDAEALARNQVCDDNGNRTPSRSVVGCGEGLPGHEIVIVDPVRRRACPADQVGEIWVRGPSVAAGYFDRPEATRETFAARREDAGEQSYLRTGDLGFQRDGQLFVTGRLKDLIIIRGRNFNPADIEHAVERAHTGFRVHYCAAFSADIGDRERLIVVQEIEPRRRDLDTDAAIHVLRRTVATLFDLETYAVVLVKAGSIPKTTSGKTRRSACRDLYLSREWNVIAEWTADPEELDDPLGPEDDNREAGSATAAEIERWLQERIAARLKVPPGEIGVHRPFLELGLGSLDAVQTSADLEAWLGRPLSPTAVYNHPTIADLARWLAEPLVDPGSDGRGDALRPAADPTDPGDLEREVRDLSQEDLEDFIQREMERQRGTREGSS
jgi:acyl carrier protein